MSAKHFQLLKVSPLPHSCLEVEYADGKRFEVDLAEWIRTNRFLTPLLNEHLFSLAKPCLDGNCVRWDDGGIEISADNLRNLGVEQNGGIGHERIWNWMHKNRLNPEQAATALGISRRMLISYRNGEKPIPRAIWLACLGWEAIGPRKDALPHQLPSSSAHTPVYA